MLPTLRSIGGNSVTIGGDSACSARETIAKRRTVHRGDRGLARYGVVTGRQSPPDSRPVCN